jgi:hypothetical protein
MTDIISGVVVPASAVEEWQPRDDWDYTDFVRAGQAVAGGMQWLLGDLAAGIETKYGERRLYQYAEDIGASYNSLQEYRRVARAWPETSTRVDFPWSVYREFAAQPDRHELIASRGEWTVTQAQAITGERRERESRRQKRQEAKERKAAKDAAAARKQRRGRHLVAAPSPPEQDDRGPDSWAERQAVERGDLVERLVTHISRMIPDVRNPGGGLLADLVPHLGNLTADERNQLVQALSWTADRATEWADQIRLAPAQMATESHEV